jgi:hypothetical protein
MNTIYHKTSPALYAAEEECKASHRALGIKRAGNRAKKSDYARAAKSARILDVEAGKQRDSMNPQNHAPASVGAHSADTH